MRSAEKNKTFSASDEKKHHSLIIILRLLVYNNLKLSLQLILKV